MRHVQEVRDERHHLAQGEQHGRCIPRSRLTVEGVDAVDVDEPVCDGRGGELHTRRVAEGRVG